MIQPAGFQVIIVPAPPTFLTRLVALMEGLALEFSATECLLPMEK